MSKKSIAKVGKVLLIAGTLGIAAVVAYLLSPFQETHGPTVKPAATVARAEPTLKFTTEREWRREFEEEQRQIEARSAEVLKTHKLAPKTVERRHVRRWAWKSPSEAIAAVWNVSELASQEKAVEGLLRICTSEQEGSREDCVGIWQVLVNVRSRSCYRGYRTLITECDEKGETMISVMRRASRYVVGAEPAKYARQRWISNMTVDCEMPKGFPRSQRIWDRNHKRHCERTVKLARDLVIKEKRYRLTRARVIAWGGRCEDPRGACDDPIACRRGLARAPGLKTANAFWCKIHSPHCLDHVDPICSKMGYDKNGRYVRGLLRRVDNSERSTTESSRSQDGEMPVFMRTGKSAYSDEASVRAGQTLWVSEEESQDESDPRVQGLVVDEG